ncbi:MAG TPA: single-stranded DNA-binding protein, partial [Oceanospirillaceae bacterium]|nr:single-stranded DNA-binding protein [Oceanospirillaceae bacterium]
DSRQGAAQQGGGYQPQAAPQQNYQQAPAGGASQPASAPQQPAQQPGGFDSDFDDDIPF